MASDEHHGIGHIAPLRILFGTGAALMFLTWLTVAVTKVDLGDANIYIALGIALVKAILVCLFFMHLRWDRPVNTITCVGSVCFVLLFIAFALTDTNEYEADRIEGDGPAVVEKISSVQAELAAAAAAISAGDDAAETSDDASSADGESAGAPH